MEIKIDSVGRVDIPKKIRTLLHWQGGDYLKMLVSEEDQSIVLKKVDQKCVLCKKKAAVILLDKGDYLCFSCARKHFSKDD